MSQGDMNQTSGAAEAKTAKSLEDVQRLMFEFIANPLTEDWNSADKLLTGASTREAAEKIIAPNDRLTSFERLEIYNKQYWFRLVDCLFDDFPGLRAVLGKKNFNRLIREYLTAFPSTSFTLRNLGSKLPDFVENNPQFCARRAKAAHEMAQFEWAQIIAFDSPSLQPLDIQVLAAKSPELLRFKLQPHMTLLALSYPFDEFIISLKKEEKSRSEASVGEMAEESVPEKASPLPKKQKVFVVVHRFDNSLYYKRIEEAAYHVLSALERGENLGAACEAAMPYFAKTAVQPGEIGAIIQGWFTNWSELGWLCPFESPPFDSAAERLEEQ